MKQYICRVFALLIICCAISVDLYSQAGTGNAPKVDGGYTSSGFLACQKNGKITLTGNVTVNETINTTGNLTIDLNGFVLRGKGEYVIDVKSGNLKIVSDGQVGHEGYLNDIGVFVWPYVSGKVSKIVNGGIIYNQKTSGYGRGIYVSGGTCEIDGVKIMGCYSNQIGTAITLSSGGTLIMKNSEISYNCTVNKTDLAGIIYGEPKNNNNNGSSISITNSILSDNKSSGQGGAICAYNVTLDNCTIKNNIAFNGAGLYIRGTDAKLEIKNSTIQYNKAIGVEKFNDNGTYSISGGAGGGAYVESGEVTIQNSKFLNNYASVNGGGIFSSANTTVEGSYITGNYAMSSETQEKPLNSGRGGGFWFQTGEFTLTNTIVSDNISMHYGGGGQICGSGTLTMQEGAKITGNTCILNGAGGLHVTGNAILNLQAGEISENTSLGGVGGGIHSSYGCTLNLTGGQIKNNTVYGRAGAININTGGGIILNGTDIIGNKALNGYELGYSTVTANTDGTYSYSTPTSSGVTVEGYGGGIAVDGGTCTMETGQLKDNIAETGGGGIALFMREASASYIIQVEVAEFTMNNGTITGNKVIGANSNGGAIYLMKNNVKDQANFNSISFTKPEDQALWEGKKEVLRNGIPKISILGGTISNNQAVGNGGVAYQEKGTEFKIGNGANLSGNTAGLCGGAVYIQDGTATVNNAVIEYNTARKNGGVLFVENGDVSLDNVLMQNNESTDGDGGGLYLGSGKLTVGSSENNSIIKNNAKNGGGICIANGTLSIGKCDIKNNKATNYGGGLYVANNSTTTINFLGGGVFDHNEAKSGGGIAVGGPITLNFQGSIQNNIASNGGGIYLLPKGTYSNGPSLVFKGGFVRNNQALTQTKNFTTGYLKSADEISGFGGGIFLDNYTSFSTSLQQGADFGFYGNLATNGADDIFANGKGTSVVLPDISNMELSDFHVPTPTLYWVEDYVTNDTGYDNGSNSSTIISDYYTAVRYQDALKASSEDIGRLLPVDFESYKGKYLCISLGYELFFLEVVKKGLNLNDVAVFRISYKNNQNAEVIYRNFYFKGRGNDENGDSIPVKIIVALPPNKWTFTENNSWSNKYEPMNPFEVDITTKDKYNAINGKVEIINIPKSVVNPGDFNISFEISKENRMKVN